jgi:hypothetical protein
MKIVSFLLIALASLSTRAQDVNFSWLKGTWKLEDKNVYEVWTEARGLLTGKSYKISATGDTAVLEKISLRKKGADYFYVPLVAENKGEVEFKMTSYSASGFVAENLKHDFPKLIRYTVVEMDNKKVLHASIEGNGKVISYTFAKVE